MDKLIFMCKKLGLLGAFSSIFDCLAAIHYFGRNHVFVVQCELFQNSGCFGTHQKSLFNYAMLASEVRNVNALKGVNTSRMASRMKFSNRSSQMD